MSTTVPWGSITDVPGVRVGQVDRDDDGWLTGVSVVVPPPGTVGAVDVRGGGPGTHETDALDPTTLVPTVDAVLLTGGSAYGLVAAHGVARRLEELGRGFAVGQAHDPGSLVVPIVPAAALFDLGRGGDPRARPDADMGYAAAVLATAGELGGAGTVRRGRVGAGTGALVAGMTVRGGVGTASVVLPQLGVSVGALVAVNAAGSPVDPSTGRLLGTAFVPDGRPRPSAPTAEEAAAWRAAVTATGVLPPSATTLAVVATNAALDPARTRRMATAAHAGLARTLDPVHTLFDGDTVFALATGTVDVPLPGLVVVHAAAATAVALAVMDAVLSATPQGGAGLPGAALPSYRSLCPSVRLS